MKEHICGLQGYNPLKDEPCPACEQEPMKQPLTAKKRLRKAMKKAPPFGDGLNKLPYRMVKHIVPVMDEHAQAYAKELMPELLMRFWYFLDGNNYASVTEARDDFLKSKELEQLLKEIE